MVDWNVPTKEQKEKELGYSKRMAEALERIAQSQATGDSLNALCVAMIDGTKAGYDRAMKAWFSAKGAESKSPAELTALVEEWYKITRVPWDGGTEFYQPNVSAVSTGTKYGDNAGMQCTPSTDTVANRDDYAGHPCFAVTDCNWQINAETKDVEITAIDGINSGFERYNKSKFVGVLQMNMYTYQVEGGSTYKRGLTSMLKPYANIDAPFGTKFSGNSFREFTIHSKYLSALTSDNKLTACAGVTPKTRVMSHNSIHTYANNVGTGYSGSSVTDWAFLQYMAYVKYASLTLDGILQGCVNHNYQLAALVSETGVQRILIASGNAGAYPVGSNVLIGARSGGVDRNTAAMYNISGADGCKVTAVEEITIDSTKYTAVYVDCAAFNTTAGDTNTDGTTVISSYLWDTGTTDCVLGNDGSPVSNTSGKYPAKLQGIEYMNGAYEVYADVILKTYQDTEDTSKYYYEPYVVKDATKQSTAITADYKATGLKLLQPATANWYYQAKQGFSNGMFYCIDTTGASSGNYHRDGIYLLANNNGNVYEVFSFGGLGGGVANGGLSLVGCHGSLANAYWYISARLTPNGCRGELAA